MAQIFDLRCKTCNSLRRAEIEAKHLKGVSARVISEWLQTECGEKISYSALVAHFRNHFNLQDATKEKYEQSKKTLDAAAEERLTDLMMIDEQIAGHHSTHKKLIGIFTGLLKDTAAGDILPSIPTAYVMLYTSCSKEMATLLKTKMELLGEDGSGRGARAMESWVDLMLEGEESEILKDDGE